MRLFTKKHIFTTSSFIFFESEYINWNVSFKKWWMIFVCMFLQNFWIAKISNFFMTKFLRHEVIIKSFDVCTLYCSIVNLRLMFWIFELILIFVIFWSKDWWAFWWFWTSKCLCLFSIFSKSCVKSSSIFYAVDRWLSRSNRCDESSQSYFQKSFSWYWHSSRFRRSYTKLFDSSNFNSFRCFARWN